MSYTKQTWVDGDLITAEKLNHIEDGIAGAGGGFQAYSAYLAVKENETVEAESQIGLSSENAHVLAFIDNEDVEVDLSTGIFVPFYVLNDSSNFKVMSTSDGFYSDDFYFGVYNNANAAQELTTSEYVLKGTFYKFS